MRKEEQTMQVRKNYGKQRLYNCTICTMYGRCELTGRGKNRKK